MEHVGSHPGEKGKGGQFVADGGLRARGGKLAVNTDGGGLCNNHPGMGGMMKILEGVRQIRGEASVLSLVTVSVTFRIDTLSTCWIIVYWPWMNEAPCFASIPAEPPPPNPPPSCDIIPPSALF